MDIKRLKSLVECRFVWDGMPEGQRSKLATDEELTFIQDAIEEKIEWDKFNKK